MSKQTARIPARERLLDAAYGLFSSRGIGQVGVDAILAEAGCAKATLYNSFGSKTNLALAFLDQREERWTRAWLETEITRRAETPRGRLLAVFDVFDGWFRRDDFEGCAFINVLLECRDDSPEHSAATGHLAKIRAIVRGQAEAAGLEDPESFAQVWHMLMKGAIVSAGEGNRDAALQARHAGELVLDGWAKAEGL